MSFYSKLLQLVSLQLEVIQRLSSYLATASLVISHCNNLLLRSGHYCHRTHVTFTQPPILTFFKLLISTFRSLGIPPFSSYRNSTVCLAISSMPSANAPLICSRPSLLSFSFLNLLRIAGKTFVSHALKSQTKGSMKTILVLSRCNVWTELLC